MGTDKNTRVRVNIRGEEKEIEVEIEETEVEMGETEVEMEEIEVEIGEIDEIGVEIEKVEAEIGKDGVEVMIRVVTNIKKNQKIRGEVAHLMKKRRKESIPVMKTRK